MEWCGATSRRCVDGSCHTACVDGDVDVGHGAGRHLSRADIWVEYVARRVDAAVAACPRGGGADADSFPEERELRLCDGGGESEDAESGQWRGGCSVSFARGGGFAFLENEECV